MNGSEKQIAYAEALRKNAISELKASIELNNADYYKNKSRDGKTPEQLSKRDEMIAIMEAANTETQGVINTLADYSGFAGTLIDCCKMRLWGYKKTTEGYKTFHTMGL